MTNYIERSQEIIEKEIKELERLKNNIGEELNEAIELIYTCKGKIVVSGIGKTGIIGRKIAASLASTGTLAIFMNATDAVHGDLGMLTKEDIVLAISNSGSTFEIMNILLPVKRIGAKIIGMTGNPDSPLGKASDIVLNINVTREVCPLNLAPTSSTTATLVMGDVLTVCLMEKRNFKAEDYAVFHPGGALGRRLLTHVRDIMSKEIPTVKESDMFKDVVYNISDGRKGMAMVVNNNGKMIGIITDGDLRRAVQKNPDIRTCKAIDIMTHGFKTISGKDMIDTALDIMTKNKITSIAVRSGNNPDDIVGLITIHDIIDYKK